MIFYIILKNKSLFYPHIKNILYLCEVKLFINLIKKKNNGNKTSECR